MHDDECQHVGVNGDSERDVEVLRMDYFNKIRDIWIMIDLEESLNEDSCNDLGNFNEVIKYYNGLPSEHHRKWQTFLDRYRDLKSTVEKYLKEPTNPEGLDYMKKCLEKTRKDIQDEADTQLPGIKQGGPKIASDFPGLQTSPINLKGKRVTSRTESRRGDNYETNVHRYLLEDFPGVCTEGYCCPEPAVSYKQACNKEWKKLKKVCKSRKSNGEGGPLQNGTTAKEDKKNAPSKIVKRFKQSLEEKQALTFANPFFIFTSYQFQNALKHVDDVTISKQEGDFDILIVSKGFGLIAGELKCSEPTSTNWGRNMSEAMFQIFKDKTFLAELFRDRPDIVEIPVHGFIALPLVQDSNEMNVGYIGNFDRKKLLFKSSLDSDDSFHDWFKNFVGCGLDSSMTEEQYLTIVKRLAGCGSCVKRNSKQHKIRVEGNQHFRHPLTSRQKEIVEDGGNQFLAIGGDYGTGKSLMLVRRAEHQRVNVGGRVVMVSCADIAVSGECVDRGAPEHSVHHLERLLLKCHKKEEKEEISVLSFNSFVGRVDPLYDEESCLNVLKNAVENLMGTDKGPLHLFFDEIPVNFLSKRYFKDFLKWLCGATSPNVTVWITIATHSYRVSGNEHSWFRKYYLPKDFDYIYLDEVLRTPKRVYNLKREISSYCSDNFNTKLVEDAEEGAMPLLYRVPSCRCSQHEKECQTHFTSDCVKKRLTCTLRVVLDELKETTPEQDSEDLDLSKIVLILSNVDSTDLENKICDLLEESCRQLNVQVKNEVSGSDEACALSQGKSILLTKDTYYVSCERHVVICVDLSAMKHWFEHGKVGYTSLVVSRCLSAYIHLSFQEEEASIFFGWDMVAAKQNRGEDLCRKIDEALEQSRSHGCLQTLLDKRVIVERSVESLNV